LVGPKSACPPSEEQAISSRSRSGKLRQALFQAPSWPAFVDDDRSDAGWWRGAIACKSLSSETRVNFRSRHSAASSNSQGRFVRCARLFQVTGPATSKPGEIGLPPVIYQERFDDRPCEIPVRQYILAGLIRPTPAPVVFSWRQCFSGDQQRSPFQICWICSSDWPLVSGT
jgi:hypothetical protein